MFEHLESLAVDEDGDDRNIIVIFDNLKGYDGMFILNLNLNLNMVLSAKSWDDITPT